MDDASTLLDLVQQHATWWAKAALARRRDAHDEASAAIRRSEVLYDRIAALLPQQPVQARTSGSGDLLWQHIPCGWPNPWHPDARPLDDCWECKKPGPWRPLLVGGDPAPERKLIDPLHKHASPGAPCTEACYEPAEPDLIAQVMAELDLTDPADVLITIQKRAAAFKRVCDSADFRKRQRDEARTAMGSTLREELAAARAEVGRLLEINRLKQKRIEELQAARPCPRCSGPLRETVGMVCQTCGTDYL